MPSPQVKVGTIAERIVGAAPCWSPGLAAMLEDGFWRDGRSMIDRVDYGSWRWLTANGRQSRTVLAKLGCGTPGSMLVELLPRGGAERYERLDLVLRGDGPSAGEIDLFGEALRALKAGEGAFEAVEALVRSVHLLQSRGDGFDVSHSDPELPFSIFVSLPCGERDASLRLAEAILHETMHLQLTLIEQHVSVVEGEGITAFSPWQRTERPIGGLVHGLYVFRAIDHWLACLERGDLDEPTRRYVSRRRRDIGSEIEDVATLADSPALTPLGAGLVRSLLAR